VQNALGAYSTPLITTLTPLTVGDFGSGALSGEQRWAVTHRSGYDSDDRSGDRDDYGDHGNDNGDHHDDSDDGIARGHDRSSPAPRSSTQTKRPPQLTGPTHPAPQHSQAKAAPDSGRQGNAAGEPAQRRAGDDRAGVLAEQATTTPRIRTAPPSAPSLVMSAPRASFGGTPSDSIRADQTATPVPATPQQPVVALPSGDVPTAPSTAILIAVLVCFGCGVFGVVYYAGYRGQRHH
jgi:hypothetical protein